MISKSQEEYLKTMYVLKIKNGEIRVTDIAESLNISKPSVTKAINNLKGLDLVNNKTYGKIELTDKGADIAKKVLEAYDISYVFLKDVLTKRVLVSFSILYSYQFDLLRSLFDVLSYFVILLGSKLVV